VFEEDRVSALPAHPFDQAIALTPVGTDTFSGHTSPAYWNMIGPFGGISAAVMLNAVMQHPSRLGEPVSLTINYASVLTPGAFVVSARPARTNRSTQHWMVEVFQTNQAGVQETVLTASAMTAVRRDTWSVNDMPMPPVPAPQDVARQTLDVPFEWLKRYELRTVSGKMPEILDGLETSGAAETSSQTQVWLRDVPPRPLDFCALATFADVFYPRVFLRRPRRVPAGTVSMTVYFHASRADLAACASGYVLGQARGQVFRNGFFDQSAQLWSESGTLLVTSLQIVYFKE
jgi:hypothetical protein